MKILQSILLCSISLLLSTYLFAKEISEHDAKAVAIQFLKQTSQELKHDKEYVLQNIDNFVSENIENKHSLKNDSIEAPELYLFTINNNEGFIIVSGEDVVFPILGYSEKNGIDNTSIPIQLQILIQEYKKQIRFIRKHKIEQDPKIRSLWNINISPIFISKPAVAPLIQTNWNQYPYENVLCPYNNTLQERTVTGCLVTAMAQIMKYWQYPSIGFGSHSYYHTTYGLLSANFGNTIYNWHQMPNDITNYNYSVAELMFHCGVAVENDYGTISEGGTGANLYHIPQEAFQKYFNYSPAMQVCYRNSYSTDIWSNILKNEIQEGRPILYSGYVDTVDYLGHAFIIDGYTENDFFHCNWGWGGIFNGYYLLDLFQPSNILWESRYSFNFFQTATIGIMPTSAVSKTRKIQVYPNPSIDNIIVESENTIIEIQIIDLNGKVVVTEACDKRKHQINISHLKANYYTVKVITEKQVESQIIQKE